MDRNAGTVKRWINVPPNAFRVANQAIGDFLLGEMTVEAVHDFQSDGFVFRLRRPEDG